MTDDDNIKRIPTSKLHQEDGAHELATSQDMEPGTWPPYRALPYSGQWADAEYPVERRRSAEGAPSGTFRSMINPGEFMSIHDFWRTMQVIVLTCSLPVFAQTKKAGAPAAPTYSQTPFDATSLRLPPHFMGNDIVRLFKAHEALRKAAKSEYETSDQFNKRMEAGETKLFMGGEKTVTMSFVAPLKAVYDADQGVLNVGVECAKFHGVYGRVLYTISVKRYSTNKTYIASNAFGAKINVRETDAESFGIGVINAADLPSSPEDLIDSAIESTPDEARRIKATLSALVICSITRGEELTVDDVLLAKATFDDPREYYEQLHALNAKVLGIWFFDSSSGRIYSKVEPEPSGDPK